MLFTPDPTMPRARQDVLSDAGVPVAVAATGAAGRGRGIGRGFGLGVGVDSLIWCSLVETVPGDTVRNKLGNSLRRFVDGEARRLALGDYAR